MDPITAPPAAVKPRRRWWLRGFAILLALLILVPLGLFGYLSYVTRQEWADAEAEADRLDPHWRFADLLAKQEAIPDNENSALLIVALSRKGSNNKGGKVMVGAAPDYGTTFENLPPNVRLNAKQLKLIGDELSKIAQSVREARRLKNLPRGRFSLTYSDDYIATPIPNHQTARDLEDWLKHDAYRLAHEGRIDEAVESCQAIICAGRVMADDLFLIAHLIRISMQTLGIVSLERVLGQGEASDKTLATMQRLLEMEMKESNWLLQVRGERGGSHMLFENIRSGKLKATYLRSMLTGKSATNVSEWIADMFPSTMLKYYPEHLRHMTECVEIVKLPIHERQAKIEAWDQKSKDSSNPIITLITPKLAKVHKADCRGQAYLRSASAALACERYRLTHKDWPASLDVLVQEKLLAAVPTDPIDGKPMRYRRVKHGIVIYSIGVDGVDNEGQIDRAKEPKEFGPDFGFRLWNKELRARPPI